jgi:hypothetical protein
MISIQASKYDWEKKSPDSWILKALILDLREFKVDDKVSINLELLAISYISALY